MRVAMLGIALDAPKDQPAETQESEGVGDLVEGRGFVVQPHMRAGRNYDHHVGGNAVRAVGAIDLPVREVAHLDQHRHADLRDVEGEVLLAEVIVRHLDLGKFDRLDGVGGDEDVDAAPGIHRLLANAAAVVDHHIDALPFVGTVHRWQRCPLTLVLEPAGAEFQISLSLIAVAFVDDDRLDGEGHDNIAVGDAVNLPRAAGRDQIKVVATAGLIFGCLREHHHVLDAQLLQHGDADVGVVVDVAQLAHRVRTVLAHRRYRQEVIRRGRRCFEEDAFLTRDASIGPVRQEHQRHRGAVLSGLAVVLPHRATATEVGVRVFAERGHCFDQRFVLVIRRSAFVAVEVVAGPTIGQRVARSWRKRDWAPGVDE